MTASTAASACTGRSPSPHLVLVYAALLKAGQQWQSINDLSDKIVSLCVRLENLVSVKERTIRKHIAHLSKLGVLETTPLFPAARHRLIPGAPKVEHLRRAALVLGIALKGEVRDGN